MARYKRIVGIDFGMKRLGLAVSDPTKLIATPMETLIAEKKGEKTVAKLLAFLDAYCQKMDSEIECIVIGMPLMMNGKRGLLADEVHHFVGILEQVCKIPVKTWDERLTTVQAERSLKESSLSRKKRSAIVDSVAAIIILQNYLDSYKG